jgi:peptidyl-prolyl cis-trans isomerase C
LKTSVKTKLLTLTSAALLSISLFACGAFAQESTVIAEFDGGKVTAEEINLFLNTVNPQYLSQLQNPQMKEMLVNQVIESAILANVAKTTGMDKDPEVKAMIELQTNSIFASRYYDKEIKPLRDAVQISDNELQQYYDSHKKDYEQNKVKASHILVEKEEDAKEIYAKVKAAPDTFAAIAKEKSIDKGSGANGGDLGYFEKGRMVPEFEKVAFETPKGQIAEPLKTRFGWHIIKVEDKIEGVTSPFEDVKETIRTTLLDNKKKEVVENLVLALKQKAHLKTYPELFAKVAPAPPAPEAPAVEATPPAPPAPPAPKADDKKKSADKKPATKKK